MQRTTGRPRNETDLLDEVRMVRSIAESAFFVDTFYAFQAEISGAREDLVRHYLEQGERRGFQPSPDFDPAFYRSLYLDGAREQENALASFVAQPDLRLVYATAKQLRGEAEAIDGAGLLSAGHGSGEDRAATASALAAIERLLVEAGPAPVRGDAFDEVFYTAAYSDAAAYGRRALRHYADIGVVQRRVRTQGEFEFRKSVIAAHFDPEFYGRHFADADRPADLLGHYVLHGARLGLDPTSFFDPDFYLATHAHVRSAGLDPFHHYVRYGMAEGLAGRPDAPWIKRVERIGRSAFFDEGFYAKEAGLAGARNNLIRHYLDEGERRGLRPSPDFDPAFYRSLYLGAGRSHDNALLDFVERRDPRLVYANRRQLRDEADAIEAVLVLTREGDGVGRRTSAGGILTALERLLVETGAEPLLDAKFDEAFYSGTYSDVASYPRRPLRHYADVGAAQRRVRTPGELEFRKSVIAGTFEPDFYAGHFPDRDRPADPLAHYVLHGAHLGLDPTPAFNAEYYLTIYEDLRHADLDPFQHFVEYGIAEGRSGTFDVARHVRIGRRAFDAGKRTVLVGLHEATRTGAPLLGLSVMEALSEHHNVVAYLGRGGEIIDTLARHVCKYVVAPFTEADLRATIGYLKDNDALGCVIYNSIEAGALAAVATESGVPVVGLIHEFAEYTKPDGRMTRIAESTDRIIVPCGLVERSLQGEVVGFRNARLRNVVVKPQGKLPSLPRTTRDGDDLTRDELLAFLRVDEHRTKVVLGAGYVQIRKGVDLFIQTAAALRRSCPHDLRFLWIGDGYQPSRDFAYGIWLADMVKRLGVEDIVSFLPPQENLDVAFSLADVFYLPSRLDPFPNVGLDAVAAATPIVCFHDATGIAEHIAAGDIAGAAVSFGDVPAAAAAIAEQIEGGRQSAPRPAAGGDAFGFGAYIAFIRDQVRLADERRAIGEIFADRILARGTFDHRFYLGSTAPVGADAPRRAVRDFITKSLNGIDALNPARGINAAALRRGADPAPTGVLTRLATQTRDALQTHECLDLSGATPAPARRLAVAVHVHLHYAELAAEMRGLFESARLSADLVLTTTSGGRALEIDHAFRGYAGGAVEVVVGRNRGRDIGPFLLDCGSILAPGRYDLVGHFHGKKSAALGGTFGDAWRNHLLDTLLGSARNLAAIESLFARDPAIGLLFAEDRNCVGWCRNRPIADDLAARIDASRPLPEAPIFPIGTMFWCRPDALSPLARLRLTARDMPVEPIAYDGTILHALERMFPWLCEVAGYRWVTAFRSNQVR